MRKFILTKLNMNEIELEPIKNLLKNILDFGFSGVFLSVSYKEYKTYKNVIKELGDAYKGSLDIATRINIDESNKSKIKSILATIRKNVDIISIGPNTRELASFVCRDGRIDIINITQNNFNLFSDSMLRMCREHNKALEFDLIDLLHTWGDKRVRILGKLKTVAKRAYRLHVRFIITVSPKSLYDLRKPTEIIFIGRILGFPIDSVKDSISIIPLDILKINREKRTTNFVLPGVKIVKHPEENEKT